MAVAEPAIPHRPVITVMKNGFATPDSWKKRVPYLRRGSQLCLNLLSNHGWLTDDAMKGNPENSSNVLPDMHSNVLRRSVPRKQFAQVLAPSSSFSSSTMAIISATSVWISSSGYVGPLMRRIEVIASSDRPWAAYQPIRVELSHKEREKSQGRLSLRGVSGIQ